MPLHLNSFTDDKISAKVLAWLFQDGMDGCESIFVDKEGKYLHIRRNIHDEISGDQIGKVCYTIQILEDKLEVLAAGSLREVEIFVSHNRSVSVIHDRIVVVSKCIRSLELIVSTIARSDV